MITYAKILPDMRVVEINTTKPLKIGIIGAGFTGTALAAVLHRLSAEAIEIVICDKSGCFGAGPAYSTPFAHHLLNVRAQDMSAFVDEPTHFTDWLCAHPERHIHFDNQIPIAEQFAPRCLYYQYLQSLLNTLRSDVTGKFNITFESAEVIDIRLENDQVKLILHDQRKIKVDKAILALGNNPPATFPFPISSDIHCIANPWDYTAINHIDKNDPVLIVGTGLSMIDAVLTLYHQQHRGMIYAVSRHGLLPLPHSDIKLMYPLEQASLANAFRGLTKLLRTICHAHMEEGGDWRSVINALRLHVPAVWERASLKDKKRFLRHLLPYWNIHRHRVHTKIMDLLSQLCSEKQLKILSGRVVEVKHSKAHIKLRHSKKETEIPIKWLINCMGPTQQIKPEQQPLLNSLLSRNIAALDPLQLGFAVAPSCALQDTAGNTSTKLFTLGAPTKGLSWEIGAVPEIRRQIFDLARHLLAMR